MRLRKSKDNELEFRKKKDKDIHNFSFKKFIDYIIKEISEDDSSSSSNSGVSDESEDEQQDDGNESNEKDFDVNEFVTTLKTIADNTKGGEKGQRRSGMIIN